MQKSKIYNNNKSRSKDYIKLNSIHPRNARVLEQ